jgi:hypothetical protein
MMRTLVVVFACLIASSSTAQPISPGPFEIIPLLSGQAPLAQTFTALISNTSTGEVYSCLATVYSRNFKTLGLQCSKITPVAGSPAMPAGHVILNTNPLPNVTPGIWIMDQANAAVWFCATSGGSRGTMVNYSCVSKTLPK